MKGEIQDQVLLNSSLNGFLFKIRHAAVTVVYHWPWVHTEASVLSSGRSRAVTSLTGQIAPNTSPSNWPRATARRQKSKGKAKWWRRHTVYYKRGQVLNPAGKQTVNLSHPSLIPTTHSACLIVAFNVYGNHLFTCLFPY